MLRELNKTSLKINVIWHVLEKLYSFIQKGKNVIKLQGKTIKNIKRIKTWDMTRYVKFQWLNVYKKIHLKTIKKPLNIRFFNVFEWFLIVLNSLTLLIVF